MRTLGLIPARAGSERIAGKNTVDLGGKPLLAWTIEAAQQSQAFDTLLVSTDSAEIAEVATAYKCAVLMRPEGLARSDTEMRPVVMHATQAHNTDLVTLLQPTSPFRSAQDITQAHALMERTGGDAVVSVTQAPTDLVFEIGHAFRMRPSSKVVVPNGAIYLVTADHLLCGGDWYSGVTYAYQMPKERSLDIDTKLDLEIARTMVREMAA